MTIELDTRADLEHLQLPAIGSATPWLRLDHLPARPDEFTFALLSDRTGGARPGVFERAVDVVNLLRPDFTIQVGDVIEGTDDATELARQWAEFDAITNVLEVPLFRVPGNHDVGNELTRTEWLRRFGALHYHFVYREVLFVVLDTQDPPQAMADYLKPDVPREVVEETLAKIRAVTPSMATDPVAWGAKAGPLYESIIDSDGMTSNISDEQIAWAEQVITRHVDVRWTVLCMHQPAWQGEGHPGLQRLRHALGERPYTMFCGHIHNYRRAVIDGRDHIGLGPTGGIWVISGDEGNFDHITLVTMTTSGPRIANIVVDAVLGVEDRTYPPAHRVVGRREPAATAELDPSP